MRQIRATPWQSILNLECPVKWLRTAPAGLPERYDAYYEYDYILESIVRNVETGRGIFGRPIVTPNSPRRRGRTGRTGTGQAPHIGQYSGHSQNPSRSHALYCWMHRPTQPFG